MGDTNSEDRIFVLGTNSLDLEMVEVKGQPKYFLKTTITTGDVDLVNDVVTEKCMESMIRQLKERTIKLDFEHEAFRGSSFEEQEFNKTRIPLGKRVSFERGEKGVDVTWELNQNWKKFDKEGSVVFTFDEIKANIEGKYYDGTSIAYIPTKTANAESKDGKSIRLLEDMVLLNVALTGNPVNTHAVVKEIFTKSLDYIKAKEDSNHTLTKLTTEEKMETKDEAKETPEAEVTEAENTAEVVENNDNNAEVEAKAIENNALKETVKSLSEEVKSLTKELSEMKAELTKPQHKSVQEQVKSSEAQPIKSIDPLDLIG